MSGMCCWTYSFLVTCFRYTARYSSIVRARCSKYIGMNLMWLHQCSVKYLHIEIDILNLMDHITATLLSIANACMCEYILFNVYYWACDNKACWHNINRWVGNFSLLNFWYVWPWNFSSASILLCGYWTALSR